MLNRNTDFQPYTVYYILPEAVVTVPSGLASDPRGVPNEKEPPALAAGAEVIEVVVATAGGLFNSPCPKMLVPALVPEVVPIPVPNVSPVPNPLFAVVVATGAEPVREKEGAAAIADCAAAG